MFSYTSHRRLAAVGGLTCCLALGAITPAAANGNVFSTIKMAAAPAVAITSPGANEVWVSEKPATGRALAQHFKSGTWSNVTLPADASLQISAADANELWTVKLASTGKPSGIYHYVKGAWKSIALPSVQYNGSPAQAVAVADIPGTGALVAYSWSDQSSSPQSTLIYRVTETSSTQVASITDAFSGMRSANGAVFVSTTWRDMANNIYSLDSANTLRKVGYASNPYAFISGFVARSGTDVWAMGIKNDFINGTTNVPMCWHYLTTGTTEQSCVRGTGVATSKGIEVLVSASGKIQVAKQPNKVKPASVPGPKNAKLVAEPGTDTVWIAGQDTSGKWRIQRSQQVSTALG